MRHTSKEEAQRGPPETGSAQRAKQSDMQSTSASSAHNLKQAARRARDEVTASNERTHDYVDDYCCYYYGYTCYYYYYYDYDYYCGDDDDEDDEYYHCDCGYCHPDGGYYDCYVYDDADYADCD